MSSIENQKKRYSVVRGRMTEPLVMVLILAAFVTITSLLLNSSRAATAVISIELENGTIAAPAELVTDTAASAGKTVVFKASQASTTPSGQGVSIPGTRLAFESQADLDADMARVASAGAKWIRFDLAAVQMETAPGQVNFSNTDRIVAAAQANNLQILGILSTLPDWSRPAGTNWQYGPTTDAQRNAFVEFSKKVVMHYNGKVTTWEIWNEPNLDQFWGPTPNTADYVKLLKPTYAAIKQIAPGAKVLTGGLGGSGGGPDIESITWTNGLYSQGAKGNYDAMNVHPYPDPAYFPGGDMAKAAQVRQIMDSQGENTVELWGTEFGTPTGGSWSSSESLQATTVTKSYDYWATMHNHGPLFFYELRDQDTIGASTDREAYFGMMRIDGTPKPAHTAYRSWMEAHPQ